jgi:hypothetical protein
MPTIIIKTLPKKKNRITLVGSNYGELIIDGEEGRHRAAINEAFRIEGLKNDQQESLGGGSINLG